MDCKECGEHIPQKIFEHDTVVKTSSNRKYCYECVPYVSRKYKETNKETNSRCIDCGREYLYERNKGHTKERCNSCMQSKRRRRIKEELIKYKGGCCSKCGYNKCIDALEFHHLDPDEKEIPIGSSWNRSLKVLKDEADKCILLCANCHREEHSKEV